MKKRLTSSLMVAASLGLATIAQAAAVVGSAAPGFSLKDQNEKLHSLADYAGKIVVLEWVNHGCPYVKKHYNSKNMPALQERFTGEGVVWLSICSSAPGEQGHAKPAEWKELMKSKGMKSSAVLIDETGTVGRLYGAKTTPHMYVIDGKGTLVYNGAIDSIPSSSVADIEKATNYVVEAIAAIKAGKPVETSTTRPYGCSVKYSSDS